MFVTVPSPAVESVMWCLDGEPFTNFAKAEGKALSSTVIDVSFEILDILVCKVVTSMNGLVYPLGRSGGALRRGILAR